jgi:hypothetical protein
MSMTWYTDPDLTALIPAIDNDDEVTVTVPVPGSMRALAAPLTLPATVEITCWQADDGSTRASRTAAVLDPAVNRGWTSATFCLLHDEDRGFSLHVTGGNPGRGGLLTGCPACGKPWALATQQAWSDDTDCKDCGHHHAVPTGD